MLDAPESEIALSSSTLEIYDELSLLPTNLIDNFEDTEQILASLPQRGISLDEIIDQLVSEEIAQSMNSS